MLKKFIWNKKVHIKLNVEKTGEKTCSINKILALKWWNENWNSKAFIKS